jgi:hypothetical protein
VRGTERYALCLRIDRRDIVVLAASVLMGDQGRTDCQQLADIIPSKMKVKFNLRLDEDSVNTVRTAQ